jgi:hypothetical protein
MKTTILLALLATNAFATEVKLEAICNGSDVELVAKLSYELSGQITEDVTGTLTGTVNGTPVDTQVRGAYSRLNKSYKVLILSEALFTERSLIRKLRVEDKWGQMRLYNGESFPDLECEFN